jgi:preprotein translocase subunit SecE
MTDEIKVQDAGTADKAKLTVAILVVIAGVAGYYVLADRPAWLRWTAVAASLVLAALVLAFSRYGHEFRQFVELARIELRKIVWPSRQETGMTTLVVFIFVVVAGIFFWLLDLGLAWATKLITGQGS